MSKRDTPARRARSAAPNGRRAASRRAGALAGKHGQPVRGWRRWLIRLTLVSCALVLGGRAVQLGVIDSEFLERQASARHVRIDTVPAHRGKLLDRHGEPLAISSPLPTVALDPSRFKGSASDLAALARVVRVDGPRLRKRVAAAREQGRRFVYVRRRVKPPVAEAVRALGLDGVRLETESRRYYPAGEVAAHLVGYTDVDDVGREGFELAFEETLRSKDGARRVIRDRHNKTVAAIESLGEPRHGQDVKLALHRAVQYTAYRALMAGVRRAKARAGSLVIIDIATGEVIAMVNQPAFNPNDAGDRDAARYRNRAVTDLFEPGSTVKPFTVAAALDSGSVTPAYVVDTAPGYMRVARRHTVRDFRNYGELDVADILRKSSNIGVARLALLTEPAEHWGVLDRLGFGRLLHAGFPGEASGRLEHFERWREARRVTVSYGYGLSTTLLQLAQAYATLGRLGVEKPVTFVHNPAATKNTGKRAMSEKTARIVLKMLEAVTGPDGTAPKASIAGYSVAGKTGTVRKQRGGKYLEKRYLGVFAGVVPASRPRFAAAVLIDDPRGKDYYGGLLAAPVFSQALAGALRAYGIAPDALDGVMQVVSLEQGATARGEMLARFTEQFGQQPADAPTRKVAQ